MKTSCQAKAEGFLGLWRWKIGALRAVVLKLLGFLQFFSNRERGQYFANMSAEEHSIARLSLQSNPVMSLRMTGQMDPVAASILLAITKSWVQKLEYPWSCPQTLDSEASTWFCWNCNSAGNWDNTKACESKKGGAKTIFPTLLFSTHTYHLIDTIRNICCLLKTFC